MKILDIWMASALTVLALCAALGCLGAWHENTELRVKLAFREAQVNFYVTALGYDSDGDIDKEYKDIKFTYVQYKRYIK